MASAGGDAVEMRVGPGRRRMIKDSLSMMELICFSVWGLCLFVAVVVATAQSPTKWEDTLKTLKESEMKG